MIYKTLDELKALVVNGVLTTPESDRDINAQFDIVLPGVDIKARNIDAGDINAGNIDAVDIKARNINAGNIKAWDITAGNIKAVDITAGNIKAGNIKAVDIDYYALCIARNSMSVHSIAGRHKNAIHKCLDKEIQYN